MAKNKPKKNAHENTEKWDELYLITLILIFGTMLFGASIWISISVEKGEHIIALISALTSTGSMVYGGIMSMAKDYLRAQYGLKEKENPQ